MRSATLLFASILATGAAFAADVNGNGNGNGIASAPSGDHPAHEKSGPQADAFSLLDANHDGVLSKVEMSAHPKAAHMAMVDENRDGVLSRGEFAELEGM